jgi:hypothetical protein
MFKPRFIVLVSMILLAAASRLIPHPPNFAPITALALFGGACFADKRWAFAAPLTAMFLGDLVLGFHVLMPVVYGSFALSVCLGFWLRRRRAVLSVAGAVLAGSVLFFVITNFGVWAILDTYPKTWEGLFACYVAAIPHFQSTLLGDVAYSGLLFGGLKLAEWGFPTLCEPTALPGTTL